MRLKTDKHSFLNQLEYKLNQEIANSFTAPEPQWYGQQVQVKFDDLIKQAISKAVLTAVEELIENQYTDEMFESDIGLKD